MSQVLQDPSRILDYEASIYSLFEDSLGRPRLSAARYELLPLKQSDIPLLIEVYKHWQTYDEYMVLEDLEKGDFFAVKCSKRGNDIYESRLKTRLGFLRPRSTDHEYFSTDFKGSFSRAISPIVLWVTFTYDSNLCSLDEAWNRIMPDFNDMITRLRDHYFDVHYIMFPQPFPDPDGEAYGYPHIHCVMIIEGSTFNVFPSMEDVSGELRLVYRIQERDEFKAIADWHSWVDVKALRTAGHLFAYVTNYSRRSMIGDTPKVDINNAVLWLYRKNGFNLSGFFQAKYLDLITTLHDYGVSEADLEAPKYKFHGVFGLSDIRVFMEIKGPPGWTLELDPDVVKELIRSRDAEVWDVYGRDYHNKWLDRKAR